MSSFQAQIEKFFICHSSQPKSYKNYPNVGDLCTFERCLYCNMPRDGSGNLYYCEGCDVHVWPKFMELLKDPLMSKEWKKFKHESLTFTEADIKDIQSQDWVFDPDNSHDEFCRCAREGTRYTPKATHRVVIDFQLVGHPDVTHITTTRTRCRRCCLALIEKACKEHSHSFRENIVMKLHFEKI